MSLADQIIKAVKEDGLYELTLRVSRYGDLSGSLEEPAAWQAIAKYQNAERGPWGVGVRADAIKAVEAALTHRTLSPETNRPEDIFT